MASLHRDIELYVDEHDRHQTQAILADLVVSALTCVVRSNGFGIVLAQAVTVNPMFTQLANQSAKSQYVDHLDRYMRLALKAQDQCRATRETLAATGG